MSVSWSDTANVLFRARLSYSEIEAYDRCFEQWFPRRGVDPGVTAEEIEAALQSIAEESRKKGQLARMPSAPQIKSAIIKARYLARKECEGPGDNACQLCTKDGAVSYWPNAKPPYTIESLMAVNSVTIPCRCDKGLKRGCQPVNDEIWRLAQEQNAAWNEATEQDDTPF